MKYSYIYQQILEGPRSWLEGLLGIENRDLPKPWLLMGDTAGVAEERSSNLHPIEGDNEDHALRDAGLPLFNLHVRICRRRSGIAISHTVSCRDQDRCANASLGSTFGSTCFGAASML